jgi:hypothetical protein
MSKKYNFVYKTTNLINGKFYIGVHSTDNLEDGYLGSGFHLQRAIQKYSEKNFKREILEFFSNKELAFEKEAEIVTEEFVSKKSNYNLTTGGKGGYNKISEDGLRRISEARKEKVISIKNGKKTVISKKEFENSKDVFGHTKGFTSVKDKTGKTFQISVNDERYKNGEFSPVSKNLVVSISKKTGERKTVSKEEFHNDKNLVGNTFGMKQSKESNLKRSLAQKGKPKPQKIVECPYCKKSGGLSNMKRWHFNNCKFSPNFDEKAHREKSKRLFNNDKKRTKI